MPTDRPKVVNESTDRHSYGRKGERILLPTCGIEVTVLRCGPGRVRIGVSAPRDVKILRGEIARRAAAHDRPRLGRVASRYGGKAK